jgi:hypothetical protein
MPWLCEPVAPQGHGSAQPRRSTGRGRAGVAAGRGADILEGPAADGARPGDFNVHLGAWPCRRAGPPALDRHGCESWRRGACLHRLPAPAAGLRPPRLRHTQVGRGGRLPGRDACDWGLSCGGPVRRGEPSPPIEPQSVGSPAGCGMPPSVPLPPSGVSVPGGDSGCGMPPSVLVPPSDDGVDSVTALPFRRPDAIPAWALLLVATEPWPTAARTEHHRRPTKPSTSRLTCNDDFAPRPAPPPARSSCLPRPVAPV